MKISMNIIMTVLTVASCGEASLIQSKSSKTKANILNNEQNQLVLGDGVNVDTADRLEKCIDIEGEIPLPEDGQELELGDNASSTFLKLQVKSINSYSELDSFTNTSVSANVSSATYGGGFNYNKTEVLNMSSDKAAVGIKASADYGRWNFKNIKLKPEYQKIYERNPNEFFRRCGTEFVSGYRLGQGISVVLSTSKESTYKFQEIQANANFSANTGTVSGNVSASFLNVASSLLKMGSLNVQIEAYGAGGLNSISSLITAQAEVVDLTKKIAAMVEKMKSKQSSRYIYLTSKYPNIDYSIINDTPIFRTHRAYVLESLFSDYRRLVQDLDRASRLSQNIRPMINSWGRLCNFANRETGKCEDYIKEIDTYKNRIQKAIVTIEHQAKLCSTATSLDKCQVAPASELSVGDLIIKRWDQQYKAELQKAWMDSVISPN